MRHKYSRRDEYDNLVRPKHQEWGIDRDHKKRPRYTKVTSPPNLPIAEMVRYIPVPDVTVTPSWDTVTELFFAAPTSEPTNHTVDGYAYKSKHGSPSSAPCFVTIESLTLFSGVERNEYRCSPIMRGKMLSTLSLGGPIEFWEQVKAYQRGEKPEPYTALPIVRLADCRYTQIGNMRIASVYPDSGFRDNLR